MKSKWFALKETAIKMRLKGSSLRDIEKKFGISKSTLSGWFKNVKLAEELKDQLKERWLKNLSKARKKAVLWHNTQKEERLRKAEDDAQMLLGKIDITNKSILELALAMLYLGEGAKSHATTIGNSNPLILNFFIVCLRTLYDYDITKIRCELHLRADQNVEEIKNYWARVLNLPQENFKYIAIDQRTIGSVTYPHYKGVCILQCGNIAIQRRLVYLSQIFCEKVAKLRAVSSAGRAHS